MLCRCVNDGRCCRVVIVGSIELVVFGLNGGVGWPNDILPEAKSIAISAAGYLTRGGAIDAA